MRGWLALPLLALLPLTAAAQEDDRDYLTAFLEDNLSGAGRKVTVTGFEGALSSTATIQQLQIADDAGVWITLDGVALDWSRSSLLSGEVVVNALTAETITLDRLPVMPADDSLPAPEAGGFALPELPVSVEIGALTAERIVLGADVLGEAIEGRLDAALTLADGAGKADLVLERTDGKESRIALAAAYSNALSELTVDLTAEEAAGGVVSGLLGLPGDPSISFALTGDGPLTDFAADVRLETDGVTRLEGPVTLVGAAEDSYQFKADVAGNLAPLFLPEYAGFLGDRVALLVEGTRWNSGRVELSEMALQAQALDLSGTAVIAGDGLPEAFDIAAKVGLPDGSPVLLPFGEGETRITGADLVLRFDARRDKGWTGEVALAGLQTDGLAVDRARLTGSGRIGREAGLRSLGGTLNFLADGIALPDAAAQAALGRDVQGRAVLHWRDGQDALALPVLEISGADYRATGNLVVEGLSTGLRTTGSVSVAAADFARFSALAGRPLQGAGEFSLTGNASRLSGAFDLQLAARTQGLGFGIAQADRLLAGEAVLTASVLRDGSGTVLRALELSAQSLRLTAAGKLASEGSTLDGQVALGTLSDLDPAWRGALTADAGFAGTVAAGSITVRGTGRSLGIGQAEVDRLIGGETGLELVLALQDGIARLETGRLRGPNLTADVAGVAGSDALRVTGKLRDIGVLAPDFSGPVALSGQVRPSGAGYDLDLRAQGPAGVDVALKGLVAPDRADLTLRGNSSAALVNVLADPVTVAGGINLDLALRGPLEVGSLSGRVTLSGGKIAVPVSGLSLQRTEVLADLAGGQVRLAGTADLVAGGRVRVGGTVALDAPFEAGLDITLEGARLRDPELYDTTLNGQMRLTGPLLGQALLSGAIRLKETELLVPSTGFASAADLAAVVHVGDGAAVRETRRRAGLGKVAGGGQGGGAGGPNWALDLTIDAPNRVFLRGRGLDAELGGSVQLRGTLTAVQPAGGIELIRGRLDLLGKRLTLSEASIVLEGDLVPYLTVIAVNESDSVTSMVTIEGPANAPEVIFSSSPELPQEEVLAWLLFGRGLETISALQALELANAVAVLAGRGGEGVITKLRKGFGFDDLDISTAEDGTASVRAGKYISRNVYTEIEVDQNGQSKINLNLDVKPGVTVKGSVGSDGQSGIGIFLEKDY